MQFIIDSDKEMECNYGEWHEHDGTIIINLAQMDSPEELMVTIVHEVLHDLLDWGVYPESTTEKQDHWVIPVLMCN